MACNEDSFQYNSTLHGRQIRLLFVEPHDYHGPDSSLLRVKLVEENLDTAVFDALSYVWGDQANKVYINCDGKSHNIGQNLHAALIEYRRRGQPGRGLWADAICINQGDRREKTEQVRMMRDIYSAADRTIIWLGPLEAGDIEAIQLAELAYKKCPEDLRYEEEGTRHDLPLFNCSDRGLPEVFRGHDIHPTWRSLFKILLHPWFSRIWIVQELLLSRNPQMWRGGESISAAALLWMANQVGGCMDLKAAMQLFDQNTSTFYAQNIALCHYRFHKDSLNPLWVNMSTTMGMEATEILDRFFALAGISEGLPVGFINYTRTLEELASQVGLMTLLGSPEVPMPDGLDLLADLPSLRLRSRQIRIPTWIPDHLSEPPAGLRISFLYSTLRLRSEHQDFPNPEFQIVTDAENSNNNPQPLTSSEFPYRYSKNCFKATVFDRIKAVVPPIEDELPLLQRYKPSETYMETLMSGLERAHRYSINILRFIIRTRLLSDPSLTSKDDVTSGDLFETFWRTLIYNRTGDDLREESRPENIIYTNVWSSVSVTAALGLPF
ncbi:heterokaryon incompatibility protein-domain-containing protein [Diplogelasinospora grovesii]|uniref:Heterokaryon incompatibility protein-domain-containing protein n=1 Tax=Diplogelasinospora grovesii TaxID=303347 RepID=A0AAN6N0M5_9PEZI|nr:heterokaryon incompatibility protein-domain-containing protein [Diplogelasinospora grovesii]